MTLDDLLEVVFNKGAVLHLDLIIAVADIPLIGVNVRAAIAGMETMLEYGMLRQWDADTRAWAERSASAKAELASGETLVARMFGGHYDEGALYNSWRPGTLFLTDRRVLVQRREPREVLWEAELTDIRSTRLQTEASVGGEERTRVCVELADGRSAVLSAAEPETFHEKLRQQAPHVRSRAPHVVAPAGGGSVQEGYLWYHEPRRGEYLWRGGQGKLDSGVFTWKSPLDARPAVSVAAREILDVQMTSGKTPGGHTRAFVLQTPDGEVVLAADDAQVWAGHLRTAAAPDAGSGATAAMTTTKETSDDTHR
ncbi:gas vesicle protein [Streptomyces sp. NPDC088746]|uniref:gas vesicle protein n=1 Tax=Streptomyces sp. NPDC088746 TaxID=3365885 RepID=UPI0038203860